MKAPKTKIKLEGEIRELELYIVDIDKVKTVLEEKTGLIYADGNFYSQTIGQLEAWKCNHSPDDPETSDVVLAATFVIAHGLAEMTGGYTAVTKDDDELVLVYTPNEKSPFVITIEPMMDEVLAGNYNYSEFVKGIEIIGTKVALDVTLDSLRMQLKDAIEAEDYELCAKLRDKITKKAGNKLSTKDQFGNRTK